MTGHLAAGSSGSSPPPDSNTHGLVDEPEKKKKPGFGNSLVWLNKTYRLIFGNYTRPCVVPDLFVY